MKNELKDGAKDEQRTAADFIPSASVEANPVLSAALSVRLIAEFMGYKFNAYPDLKHNNITKPNETEWYYASWDLEEFNRTLLKELPYHSSWELLMSVVEKIESIVVNGNQWTVIEDESNVDWNFEVCIESKQCTVNRCAYDGDEEDFLSLYDCRNYNKLSKKEVVCLAVGKFIKWYNENAVSVGSR